MIRVPKTRRFPVGRLALYSTVRSAGTRVAFQGQEIEVTEVAPGSFAGIDFALFAAGADASRQWAPVARQAGATVIDNSNAFRYDDDVPLVVPEVNPHALAD